MPYITVESGALSDQQKELLIKRLTEVSSEIMNAPHPPAVAFYTVQRYSAYISFQLFPMLFHFLTAVPLSVRASPRLRADRRGRGKALCASTFRTISSISLPQTEKICQVVSVIYLIKQKLKCLLLVPKEPSLLFLYRLQAPFRHPSLFHQSLCCQNLRYPSTIPFLLH